MKFSTPVEIQPLEAKLTLDSKILLLGSCFSDEMGVMFRRNGFHICSNPFGTLYNPLSVLSALRRIASGEEFGLQECVEMGAGAGLICSFSHHTSFARATAAEFLEEANKSLREAAAFWNTCDTLIITLGTSYVYRHDGTVVANCLKRNAKEFTRDFLPMEESLRALREICEITGDSRRIILTVSPIRHMSDGAHGNQLSKSTLLLAEDTICREIPERCSYFPTYEILMDELRDYRFYNEDMAHPSGQAIKYIWEKFVETAVEPSEKAAIREAEKAWMLSRHRPLHP